MEGRASLSMPSVGFAVMGECRIETPNRAGPSVAHETPNLARSSIAI
jgi:hypothetical protein